MKNKAPHNEGIEQEINGEHVCCNAGVVLAGFVAAASLLLRHWGAIERYSQLEAPDQITTPLLQVTFPDARARIQYVQCRSAAYHVLPPGQCNWNK